MQINVEGTFCSTTRTLASVNSLNMGIGAINEILKRELLCRHDVEYINRIYTVMQRMSDFDLKKVSQELAPRMRRLSEDDSSKRKIFFHYMKILGPRDLIEAREQSSNTNLEEIASLLPICSSEAQFEEDVEALIGTGSTGRVNQILSYKKEQIKRREETKRIISTKSAELISTKSAELDALKTTSSKKIPEYMSELLKNGHIQLFDHLMAMMALPDRNTRRSVICALTFSQISHIVLQTRDAIIQKVESSILNYNKQILFILGSSGSGKSTTLCAIRGDEMKFENGHYVSQNDPTLIAHGSSSCTFLPTVEHVGGCIVVDFPGFNDTNGPLVSLGMECALKALVEKYNPGILVLESITNTEGRYEHVAQLSNMLGRLFNDCKKCILGITKYKNDADYNRIEFLEIEKRKTLLAPTPEEQELINEISFLKKYKMTDQIKEKEEKLALIKSSQEARKELLSLDTTEIQEYKENLKVKEGELIKHINMKKVVLLQNLEDKQHAALIFKEIMMLSEPVSVCERHRLDPEDSELLKTIFTKTLFAEIEKDDYDIEDGDFSAFEQSILESSLIKTLKARSNPEIGRFLHLPQLDPMIVRHYDEEIVDRCITKYMNFVIKTIHISLIDSLCNEKSEIGSKQKIAQLQRKIAKLKNYVLQSLTGISFVYDPVKAAKKWNEIQRELNSASTSVQVQLPAWANFFKISDTVFNKIYDWLAGRIQQQAYLEASDNVIDECCTEVDNMYDTLQRLNDIKIMIKKQNDIDNAFSSVKISMESFYDAFHISLIQRTLAVAKVYGKDWDKRVDFLVAELLKGLKGFNQTDKSHRACLLGYAYWLIEPDVHCLYQVEIGLDDIESVIEAIDEIAEKLQCANKKTCSSVGDDKSWKAIGSKFIGIGKYLRRIESEVHLEIERGIELYPQKGDTQCEILRSIANAVGDAASFAENLSKPYEGDADHFTLVDKINIAYELATLATLNPPAKALVSSWSSWSNAVAKANLLDQKPTGSSSPKETAKKLFNYKLTLLKKNQKQPSKVEIFSKSEMFELDKEIWERYHTNRPLIRTLLAAALLELYQRSLYPDIDGYVLY